METFKDRFEDLLDDFKGRVKNPLILSFILVWFYQHWRLVYQFFTIDSKFPFLGRIKMFDVYIKGYGYKGLIVDPLMFAFGSLIVFYVIGIAAQAIKLFVGKRLSAALFAKYDTGSYEIKANSDRYKREYKRYKLETDKLVEQSVTLKEEYNTTFYKLLAEQNKVQGLETEKAQLIEKIEKFRAKENDYNRIINDEKNFMNYRTRKALFQMFDYKFDSDTVPVNCNINDLFFGKWDRTVFTDNDGNNSNGAATVYFDERKVLDAQKRYSSTIESIEKMGDYDIFRLKYLPKNGLQYKEMLYKLDSDLIIGITYENDAETTRLVEYRRPV